MKIDFKESCLSESGLDVLFEISQKVIIGDSGRLIHSYRNKKEIITCTDAQFLELQIFLS